MLWNEGRRVRQPRHGTVVAYVALFVALGGGAVAATSYVDGKGQLQGCVSKKGQLTVLKPGKACPRGQTKIAWNAEGRAGRAGDDGDPGDQGPRGETGPSTGPASGDLAGSYPGPTIAPNAVTTDRIGDGTIGLGDLNSALIDAPAATPSLRTLGTGAAQGAAGDDPRLSDTRFPKPASVGYTHLRQLPQAKLTKPNGMCGNRVQTRELHRVRCAGLPGLPRSTTVRWQEHRLPADSGNLARRRGDLMVSRRDAVAQDGDPHGAGL